MKCLFSIVLSAITVFPVFAEKVNPDFDNEVQIFENNNVAITIVPVNNAHTLWAYDNDGSSKQLINDDETFWNPFAEYFIKDGKIYIARENGGGTMGNWNVDFWVVDIDSLNVDLVYSTADDNYLESKYNQAHLSPAEDCWIIEVCHPETEKLIKKVKITLDGKPMKAASGKKATKRTSRKKR